MKNATIFFSNGISNKKALRFPQGVLKLLML